MSNTTRIFRAPEPARVELPDGWEWKAYGARHIATGICVCWSHNGSRFVADSIAGAFKTWAAAISAVERAYTRIAA